MKKISTTITAAALALVAFAAPVQAATPAHSNADARGFISAMRAHIPEMKYLPKTDIHELGDAVCGALQRKPDVEGLAMAMYDGADEFFEAEDVGFIIGASASFLCPKEVVHIQAYIDSQS